jgi:receptor-binding and translocation channel-forming TcA subunit of Tc toxin/ABC toxin-like protein/neuraminidase-like protein/putative peptidoglycan binding protein
MVIEKSQLQPGSMGESVNHLHQRLALLGFDVPADERRDDRYGSGTEAAIRRFQSANGLPVANGRVDDDTARGLGLGGYPTSVAGIVCRPDGTPLPSIAVRLFQHSAGGEKVVAESRSDAGGKFSMPWPPGISGGLGIRAEGSAARTLSWKAALSTGSIWVRLSVGGEYRGATRFAVLTQALAPLVEAGAFHTVGGAGRAAELTALGEAARVPGLDVSRYVLSHKLAARTGLDPRACFALLTHGVTPEALASLAATGSDADALDDAHVDQVLSATLAEHCDQLRAGLAAAIAGNLISELDVDAAVHQLHALRVDHLAQRPIAWLSPRACSEDHACCAAASAPVSAGTDPSGGEDLADATRPLVVHDAPLGDVIATSVTDPAARRQVLEAFAAHGQEAELATVVQGAAGLSPEQRSHLRFTLEAAALLGNHLPLVSYVQGLRAAKVIATVGDLARFDEADWADFLHQADPGGAKIALPAAAGAAAGDRIARFARALARRLEARYPTTALSGRLAKAAGALPLARAAAVQQFLDRSPAFCVRHTHIDRFLHETGTDALPAGDDHAEVIADLKTLQRAYKLTSRFDHAKAMLDAGHRSAHSIHAVGPEQFATQMAAVGVPGDEASAMFARADQVHATSLTLMANFNSAFNGVTPAAVAAPRVATAAVAALASLPTVQSLFGTADFCACSDCRSVHGSAAYLVDILEFLKSRMAPDGTTSARDVVLGRTTGTPVVGRRPDLKFVQLSCSNTNGVVPYVDLVCEILEDAVGSAPIDNDLKARQTSGTAEELRANPAFVRDAAYTALSSATFPIAAPFDLFGVTVRAFLRQLGIARNYLMSAFQNGSGPTDTQIAAERFELNATALSIITTAAPSTPWTLWGLLQTGNTVPDPRKPDDTASNHSGAYLDILAFVPILLDRAKLSHRELIQVLEARFVNPNTPAGGGNPAKALWITETGITVGSLTNVASCDTGLQSVTGLTDDLITRFNRFIRLWRQLGCTLWDLDKVVMAPQLCNGVLDATAIAQLGKLDMIARRLNLPWDELLTLWGAIDTVDYINVLDPEEPVVASVYKRKFRSATIAQVATVFTDNPASLTGTLDDANAIAGISAALAISADELKRIRAAAGLATPGGGAAPALNLNNLSAITRYVTLARGLGLSIYDLLTAIAVSGVNPFPGSPTPATTLQFFTAIDQIQGSGFTLPELNYLLLHGSVIDSKIGLSDTTITTWLDDVRRALVRLGTTDAATAADVVVRRLSALLPLDLTLTQQVLQATLPGASQTMASLFTSSALTARNTDGSFTTATTRGNFPAIYDACTAIDKLRIVLARWNVSPVDALWLLNNAHTAGWLELHTLPAHAGATTPATLDAFDTLHKNVVVQQTLASPAGVRLFDFVLAPGGAGSGALAAAVTNVAQIGGWTDADINALATRFNWTTPGQLVAGATVPRIRDLMAWPRKLGTDVTTTLLFAGATVGTSEAGKARQLTKSRFSNDEWLGVAAAIQDRLREQKRAALVAYLLANPQSARTQKWVTVEDLYGFFLIDPQMSPAADTTRIKQAVASLQLFIQRCFLQLELFNVDSDSVWKQWDWMKRFRLWEANRKIFLYPENWYNPAQRRDSSPYFQALVNDLQQTSLTNDVAEDALRSYLHKLVDVAHLEVSGLWEEPVTGTQPILHVVARTRKTPYVYSYRRRESTGAWSAWEPLDDGTNADHIMPVIWNKRLFMLWTEFTEKAQPVADADHSVPSSAAGTQLPLPRKYWEIALSWIERRNNLWLPKRQAQRKQIVNGVFSGNSQQVFKWQVAFRAATPLPTGAPSGTTLTNLALSLYEPTGASSQALGQWLLTSPQDEPLVLNTDVTTLAAVEDMKYIAALPPGTATIGARPKFPNTAGNPVDMNYNFNAFGGDALGVSGALGFQRPVGSFTLTTILGKITMARVINARFGDNNQFSSPFFISDPQRTFFGSFGTNNNINNTWKLQTFYHPYADAFVQQLNQGGIPGLYDRALQVNPDAARGLTTAFDFVASYTPNTDTNILATPYPTETIDYTQPGPYAIYNWELFLHTPLLIAKQLADNQRFDEALRWFHYIFNPNTVNLPGSTSAGPVPARYWNPKVFRDLGSTDYVAQQIEQVLAQLDQTTPPPEVVQRVTDWRNNPFDPNLVAAARPVAYQKAVVMAYISTLIAWGDQLFRGDSVESINEATQLYLLASQLLGPRPQSVRAVQPKQISNYQDLGTSIDAFANVMVNIENLVSLAPPTTTGSPPTPTILHTFYFCIPPNDQMLSTWDTVADRLFKIRNGMNLDGVTRPLALFDAPIDPGLLARAAAAGIDIATALADAAVNVGCYRFQTLWQTAHDLCQDVRGLGSAILSATERKDSEEMARLKTTQEVAVTTAVRQVKVKQLEEAKANKTALLSTRAMAEIRKAYYEDPARRNLMNDAEAQAQDLNTQAQHNEEAAQDHDRNASRTAWIPSITIGVSGFGGTPTLHTSFGVENYRAHVAALTAVLRDKASINSRKAGQSTTFASYTRRLDDWTLQLDVVTQELDQLDKQLLAADLRIAVAENELAVQDRQIADAQDTAALLQSKYTNQELYSWMLSQLSSTYFQSYQLAYDLAKRASKAYSFELGQPDPGFIQFGYWDSLHNGLVAGDKLLLDLRRLQAAHLNNNTRELEITKHVSLLQLEPEQLVRLRETGSCDFTLPESLFDLDQPGHFYRRLKTVSVTLPCVTGPYNGVNGTLMLSGHSIRKIPDPTGYASTSTDSNGLPSDPSHFIYVPSDARTIALSTGREDSGMFELSLRDERYLPFEGAGAISRWHIDLQQQNNRFDLATLSDAVLHVRYTARNDDGLRQAASDAASAHPPAGARMQLLSARTEFPDAYARLFAPTGSGQRLDLALGAQHFPFIPASQQLTFSSALAILTFTNDANYNDYKNLTPGLRLTARIGLTPGDGTVPTVSKPFAPETAHMTNVPATDAVTLSGPIAPVTIGFVESELVNASPLLVQPETQPDSTVLHRLIRDKIDDILIVINYQVGART